MSDGAPMRRRRSNGPPSVRHGRLHKRRPYATVAKVLVATLGVLIVSGGSIAAIAAWDVARTIKPGVHLALPPGKTAVPIPSVGAIDGGVNLLLTGTDTRTGQGGAFSTADELSGSSGAGNNDVTMLVHIAQNHQSAMVVSFPRDMMIPIPECPNPTGGTYYAVDKGMMNSTLSRGGLSCVVLTIEKLTGVSIPFAAEVSFDGVSAMSNAVGGVTVCLASPVVDKYTNPPLDLAAGEQTIVGPEALSFLRSRHGVGDGSDLGRISNQQVFLSALARKIVNGGVLANPFQLYPLAKAAASNMTLSDTLTNPTTMVQIALALKNTGLDKMTFIQYPVVTDPDNVNRVIPHSSSAEVLNNALVNDLPVQLTGTTGRAAELAPGSPTATPTPTQAAAPSTPGATTTPGPTTAPAPATSGPAPVVLPSDTTGQTANQQTCTKGNG
ncbi:LCP family protein [Diaminobutyricibacter tongyongensis]|uniref:LCP family protein n=1 Tax=Leifsonia tongyongensis TaxID=1268043 RepID=A0A6L9XYN3_9MICO|nr:LCP family protein [Diaminobutyricibacter tongyongensis]NEN06530.1 LCP family protein [Diaminobutyricibacter tongyongensis]